MIDFCSFFHQIEEHSLMFPIYLHPWLISFTMFSYCVLFTLTIDYDIICAN